MRILITGEAGLLGHAFAAWVRAARPRMRVLNDTLPMDVFVPYQPPAGIFSVEPDAPHRIPEIDISHPDNVARLSRVMTDRDVIVHMAGYNGTEKCETYAYDAVKSNVLGTQRVVELAHQTGARLIHASTPAIYKPGTVPVTESSPIQPFTLYGLTKEISEHLIPLVLSSSQWLITRPVFVYGDAPRDNISMIRRILHAAYYQEPATVPLDPSKLKDYFRVEYFTPMFGEVFLRFCIDPTFCGRPVLLHRGAARPFQEYVDIMGIHVSPGSIKQYVTFLPEADYFGDYVAKSEVMPVLFPTFTLPADAYDDHAGIAKTFRSIVVPA